MWPVCTKFVGFPIMDRSIRSRWWCLRRLGLCGCWKQHENHCSQISPVLAILPLFSLFSTLAKCVGRWPVFLAQTNKEELFLRGRNSRYGRMVMMGSAGWRRLSEAKVPLGDNPIAPRCSVTNLGFQNKFLFVLPKLYSTKIFPITQLSTNYFQL